MNFPAVALLAALSGFSQASEVDQYYLAEALYFEARSESDESQHWIASVILNRREQIRYPNTIKEVVHEYKIRKGRKICQFSYYCDGKSDEMVDREEYKRAWINAGWALSGLLEDPTDGADHYYNPKLASPKWGPLLEDVMVSGNHVFGKLEW